MRLWEPYDKTKGTQQFLFFWSVRKWQTNTLEGREGWGGKVFNNIAPQNFFPQFCILYVSICSHRHLMDLIFRCATLGESNSALLIGPRGSGKSMVSNYLSSSVVTAISIHHFQSLALPVLRDL